MTEWGESDEYGAFDCLAGQKPAKLGAIITVFRIRTGRTTAAQSKHLYVFVLSEDKSFFSKEDRLNMVKAGIADLSNVTVLPSGPYLISSATFPTYFLKDRDAAEQIHCQLDIAVFIQYYAPRFHITRRYVGTEPLSAMTAEYNKKLPSEQPDGSDFYCTKKTAFGAVSSEGCYLNQFFENTNIKLLDWSSDPEASSWGFQYLKTHNPTKVFLTLFL